MTRHNLSNKEFNRFYNPLLVHLLHLCKAELKARSKSIIAAYSIIPRENKIQLGLKLSLALLTVASGEERYVLQFSVCKELALAYACGS